MKKLSAYFFDSYHAPWQSAWFKRLLYGLVILKCGLWLLRYDLFFGANSIVYSKAGHLQGPDQLAFFLYSHPAPTSAYYFIIPLLALCLLALALPRLYFLPDVFIWLLVLNLHNRLYATLTGGDYLLNQLLLFSCFLSADFTLRPTAANYLKRCGHNLAIVAVMVQVCLVYLFSALAKLNDAAWLSGKAVGMVAQVNHYSLPALKHLPTGLAMALNYLALAYQLLFPALIWVKKIKKPLIVSGIFMHLCIALFMGLPLFSVIMILPYIYFWPSKKQASK